ncbi:hypothetical protein RJ639_047617 [Escallonia herrerae]|uniref:Pentatricopeptide repeat-containing protein n=1 Tax=Escallonia herrerae TaxID=1293975 RepID=A0AA88W7V9_9ASTE|nr:hypothetical protein RJ639_047617 [Escallonia herrerae]
MYLKQEDCTLFSWLPVTSARPLLTSACWVPSSSMSTSDWDASTMLSSSSTTSPTKATSPRTPYSRGFVDAGHFSKAVELYHSMLRLGLVPDNYTYPLILKACSGLSALEKGRKPDAVILAALLPSCGRLEAKPAGMALQGCAVRSGFESDLFLTNALVDMYCKCGDTSEAFFVFANMICKDLISWSTLSAGYAQNSQYRESLEIY